MLFSVCSGGSGNSGYSYAWSPAFGLNDATVANPVATISSDTTYSVIVTDTIGGCADTASISLQVVPNFTYTFSQSDSLICENDPVQFSVLPSAPGSYVYDWEPGYLFSDTLISDPVAVFDSAGTNIIFFEVSNAGGCTKSDSISLLVLSSPGLMVTGDLDICENDSAQLTASGGMSYTWNPPSGLNDPDISNPKASPDSTTTYSITATGANGCTSAGSVQVIVFPLPDIALGDDTAFCDSITLDAGSGFISYLWSTGSTAPSITVTTPGTYSVAVKDSMGCTNKDTININGSGLLAQVTNAPANMCITDNSITLSGSPPGGTFIGPGTTTGGVFSPALAGLGSHNIIYFVNVNGCLDEDTATITVDSCLVGANVIRPRETQFHVYPNPNNGRFVLEFSSHPSTECYLKMYNGAGAVVHQSQIKNLKTEIAPGNLTPGVYLLQLIHEAGIINRKILVE
jgi:hypothetical protein